MALDISPERAIEIFFFQAEDGIRDGHVTGVQTCALPISATGELVGLDIRVIRADELARRRRYLRRAVAGRLDHGDRTCEVLRDRLRPIQRGAADRKSVV